MAMTIVNDILKQMPAVGRPQRKFLVLVFSTIPHCGAASTFAI
jgi:hypothetical protein